MHILKQLKTKKGRDEAGLFVVEGEKCVAEIPPGWQVVRYILSQSYAQGSDAPLAGPPTEILRDALFASYAPAQTPQGIVALCRQRKWGIGDVVESDSFIIYGECLQDPGNVGTLIRTAAAAGAGGMILTAGSADMYSPKVLRAAAGAALRLPVAAGAPGGETLAAIKQKGFTLYAAHPRGDALPYELDMKKGFCLLVGNEARGLSDEALAMADARVRLPMANETESLNASVAGSVLLYEAVRQRLIHQRAAHVLPL
ncbi:MAG: RNA methyltransferase [Defluviitaleaceae bacterium]|nr:RNA methyltransferase [Defluviitaleaceae bacterium]MCL2204311.1 RNA methyltransferase [Defluviitaleaceae bacterium]MCL2240475.1 RNA methyltransferase [Defluviitaleaceae bacterium]